MDQICIGTESILVENLFQSLVQTTKSFKYILK